MGRLMSPRIVLATTPELPRSIGEIPLWNWSSDFPVGDLNATEYRHSVFGHLVVISTVCSVNSHWLLLCWVSSEDPDGENAVFDALSGVLASAGLIVARWRSLEDLETDPSKHAQNVLNSWPEHWREVLPGDVPKNAIPGETPVPPRNGPRTLGASLA